jgi:deoxyribose-phosphate aldolase
MPAPDLATLIDHTLLRANATPGDVERLCEEALRHEFAAVCVNGVHVARAARLLGRSRVAVACTVGFPLGAMDPVVKRAEAEAALAEGAREIDMVLQIGALRAGLDDLVREDIAGVARVVRRAGGLLKVILECCYLDDQEKIRGCRLAELAGCNFVKTSTGLGPSGANEADVSLLRRSVSASVRVKAAGGIRTAEDARALVRAGASRLGTSASVAIVTT